MKSVLYYNIKGMNNDNLKEHTECTRINPKFMKATLGPTPNTTWI